MTAKDILLLLRHRYQFPVARSKLKFLTFFDKKAYLDAVIFFGFSNSEFINDNTFNLKDKKKKQYRDFKVEVELYLLEKNVSHMLKSRHAGRKSNMEPGDCKNETFPIALITSPYIQCLKIILD